MIREAMFSVRIWPSREAEASAEEMISNSDVIVHVSPFNPVCRFLGIRMLKTAAVAPDWASSIRCHDNRALG